jgi:hypothetical protein
MPYLRRSSSLINIAALPGWDKFYLQTGHMGDNLAVPQPFLRANGVNMLTAAAVGMLESRAFGEISKEEWKQIVVSTWFTFPAFPRALAQNLRPESVNHVPGLYL